MIRTENLSKVYRTEEVETTALNKVNFQNSFPTTIIQSAAVLPVFWFRNISCLYRIHMNIIYLLINDSRAP